MKVQCVCVICGASFMRNRHRVEKFGGLLCSRQCGYEYRKRFREQRVCKTCGKVFELRQSEINQPGKTGTYCSRACYLSDKNISDHYDQSKRSAEHNAKISAANRGKPRPHQVKPDATVECTGCGAAIIIPGRRAYKTKRKWHFCSRECYYEHVRQHPELSSLYLGGGYYGGYGETWRKQSAAARKRDNYTCQRCGLRQFRPPLHVHHIRPLRTFGGDHITANSLENLITLCPACHAREERRTRPE